jgi:hypothetical protein
LTLHGFTITNTEEDKPKASKSEIAAAITDLISHLPSLEHLDFAFSWDGNTLPAAEDGIAPDPVKVLDLPTSLSTMQHLKSLSLPWMATTPGNLALLPTSLTLLELEGTTRPDKDYGRTMIGCWSASVCMQCRSSPP